MQQVEEFRSAACWWNSGEVKKTLAKQSKTDSAAILCEGDQ
jgi:hypothetical protein